MGRPRKEIDPVKVKKLAGMGLSGEEIAAVMDCDKRTIERRFAAVVKEGRQHLTSSLKRRQYAVAMRGNVGMLIWLGKQYLGQREPLPPVVATADTAVDAWGEGEAVADRHEPAEPPAPPA